MSAQTTLKLSEQGHLSSLSMKAQTFTIRLLAALVWSSTLLFGLYILAFYGVPFFQQDMASWNETLPNLFHADTPSATAGMGIHFIFGGIILILGCLQLVPGIRERAPRIHRVSGRVYIASAMVTSLGGLLFILVKGTIGGWVMDVGFSLYGVLMFVCALKAYQFARAGNFTVHREWALRLFALAIGSWLYRMEYGFWFLFTDNLGHADNFQGPFDYIMDFFFFVPNLLVVELILRRKRLEHSLMKQWISTTVLLVASLFVALGTYSFTQLLWGPAILGVLGLV